MEIATFAVSHPTMGVDAAALPVLREQERSVPNGGALDRTLKVKRKGSICGTRTYTFLPARHRQPLAYHNAQGDGWKFRKEFKVQAHRSRVVVDVAAFKVSHSVLGGHDATALQKPQERGQAPRMLWNVTCVWFGMQALTCCNVEGHEHSGRSVQWGGAVG